MEMLFCIVRKQAILCHTFQLKWAIFQPKYKKESFLLLLLLLLICLIWAEMNAWMNLFQYGLVLVFHFVDKLWTVNTVSFFLSGTVFLCIPLISTLDGLALHCFISVFSMRKREEKTAKKFYSFYAFIVLLALSFKVIFDFSSFRNVKVFHLFIWVFILSRPLLSRETYTI